MNVVTPVYRPKSVRIRCVIEGFGDFLCCPLVSEFSVGIGAFVWNGVRSPSFSLPHYCEWLYFRGYKFPWICLISAYRVR